MNLQNILQRIVSLFQSGGAGEALGVCDQALKQWPGEPELLHLRAMLLGNVGRIDEADDLFRTVARVHANKAAVASNHGNALLKAGRVPEAIDAFRRAVKSDAKFVNGHFNLGMALVRVEEYEEALKAFDNARSLQDRHIGAQNGVSFCQLKTGALEDAVASCSKVLEWQENNVAALVNRGIAHRDLGNVDAALMDHKNSVKFAPNSADAHFQLGNSLRQAGELQKAIAEYQAALQIDPSHADTHKEYAKLLWEMGDKDSFLAPLNAGIAKAPSLNLHLLHAELAIKAGDFEAAEVGLRETLRKWPKNPKALAALARINRIAGHMDEAGAMAHDAFKQAQQDFEIIHDYAEILLLQNDYAAALKLLDVSPPTDHLQKHVALRVLALRGVGDNEYRQYYDYERLTKKIFVEPPARYASLEAFNAAVAEAIEPLHGTKVQPIDQTLYGGTQSMGRLWNEKHPVIQELRQVLLDAASRYVQMLPDDPEHPFLSRKPNSFKCVGAWSVMLKTGGGHVDHIHPAGWVSGCYYVSVPPEVLEGEKAGFLRLGGSGVKGLTMPAEEWVQPEPGAVVFFPSYMWHGVERFEAETQRITAPFDLAPAN